ncbi:MAG: hypothetical protein ABJA82_06485 [Myxococcales bacterium]
MKLLIIAGPYEADRIRRAAVVAGFEAVAIEPGESLSGWITATRPDVIILAPQIVSADAAVALAKVRAVPRGRVPIFLVGEAHEREFLQTLGDGFFVRPVAPDELLARAREAVGRVPPSAGDRDDVGSGPDAMAESRGRERPPTLRPLVAARPGGISAAPAITRAAQADPPLGVAVPRPGKTSERWPPAAPGRASTTPPRPNALPASLLDTLAQTIDADFDAELRDVVRAMATGRPALIAGTAPPSARGGETGTGTGAGAGAGAAAGAPAGESTVGESPGGSPTTPEVAPAGVTAEEVRARRAQVQEGDYFQILGVPADAGAAQIASACQQLLAQLSADTVPRSVAERWAAELAEIRTVVAEAGRLLANESLRRQYRAHLVSSSGPPPLESEGASR